MQQIFITGLYRSGTTLTEKLLTSHPNGIVGSQPIPYFYFFLKNKFLKSINVEQQYPLDSLFLNTSYNYQQFTDFVEKYTFSISDILSVFENMKGDIGHWTPEIFNYVSKYSAGNLKHIYQQTCEFLHSEFGADDNKIEVVGTKEIYAEEFVPYYLQNNIKVVQVIRDPRNVLTSLNFGDPDVILTGNIRPTLFTIRAWRKSVAYAIKFGNHPNMHVVRYEDIVNETETTLNNLSDFMGISKFDPSILQDGLKNQKGENWGSNSSFSKGENAKIKNKYAKYLEPDTIAYFHATAAEELSLFGYIENELPLSQRIKIIEQYKEQFEITHQKFNHRYTEENASLEIQRLNLLNGDLQDKNEIDKWFLFEAAFERLRNGNE